jgi:SAM-dependent methyltransferase
MRCRKPIDLEFGLAVCILAIALALSCTGFPKAPHEEAGGIAEAIGVESGMRIADVGAGDGRWAEDLALRVGETGHVYATEIHGSHVREIERRMRKAGLENVTAILGDADAANLPEACCDAILLRMVYHHFTDPESMRRSLGLALRPGGVVVIIETEPHKDWPAVSGVPDRGGHGIAVHALIEEMASDGFDLVERHDRWAERDDRYCVVFRRRS